MSTQTNPSNEPVVNPLAHLLKERGINSGRKLAIHTEAPAVIYFLMTKDGGKYSPRAELHYGQETVVYRSPGDSLGAIRQKTVAHAKEDAYRLLGIEDWNKTPFSNCWLPAESMNRMRSELGVDLIV